MRFRLLPKGSGSKHGAPINIALVDEKEIIQAGVDEVEALKLVAEYVKGPVAINIFNMEAVTTTSDGIIVPGAIVTMAAADRGIINNEFGVLHMEEIEVDDELIATEPHLAPLKELYPGRRLFRGPNPAKKIIPVHNVVMTGKAVNNNSATEVMNAVTMEEMLLPILGQLEAMKDRDVIFAITGGVISVGIGMTVAEKYGRVFPTPQFPAGETAHNCGEYAKTLKANIPCIVAPKEVLAHYILDVLDYGLIPGRHIGCSPAVLAVAHAYGTDIDFNNISDRAWLELESIGVLKYNLKSVSPKLTRAEIISKAEEIVPGLINPIRVKSVDYFQKIDLAIGK